MAETSEDPLLSSRQSSAQPVDNSAEDEFDDPQVADFRFLTLDGNARQTIPSRGLKDFEPHGTQLQVSTLAASRDAMYNVLKEERLHRTDPHCAIWDPVDNGAWVVGNLGKYATMVGRFKKYPGAEEPAEDDSPETKGKKRNALSRLYLLPEEVLWLVERGTLDIRWPAEPGEPENSGLPMSVQGAHATFIGMEKAGGLTLEKFVVYQHLRRAGYVVFRAEDNWHNIPIPKPQDIPDPPPMHALWKLLASISEESEKSRTERQSIGPLVRPGLYRDYKSIYRLLNLVPYHNPSSTPALIPPSSSGPSITWHVYKPDSHFRKSAPGPPHFYISVINACEQEVPSEADLEALLRQTPFHPDSGTNLNQKLKKGTRNVILAVVDMGLVSFINVADASFGTERLWERERKPGRGWKGRRGAGRGRGRGR